MRYKEFVPIAVLTKRDTLVYGSNAALAFIHPEVLIMTLLAAYR